MEKRFEETLCRKGLKKLYYMVTSYEVFNVVHDVACARAQRLRSTIGRGLLAACTKLEYRGRRRRARSLNSNNKPRGRRVGRRMQQQHQQQQLHKQQHNRGPEKLPKKTKIPEPPKTQSLPERFKKPSKDQQSRDGIAVHYHIPGYTL